MRLARFFLPLALLAGCTGGPKDDDTSSGGGDDGADPVDADGDGYDVEEDCNDDDASVYPGAPEVCDGIDNDCDDAVDDADDDVDTTSTTAWYPDVDGDGFGRSDGATQACEAPEGSVDDNTDCDDDNADIHPDAAEVCDGEDNDCDELVDDDDDSLDADSAPTWYADADTDGYGDAAAATVACEQPSGTVTDDSDCDDTDSAVNPAATEVCDTVDNDCDGLTDDEDDSLDTATATSWYADTDTDGYGDLAAATVACEQPSGTVTDATDCDDTDGAVNPAATEVCDTVDNDCDGDIDDADASLDTSTATTWFADTDTDTYGDATSTSLACDQPSGFVSDSTDCDDTDSAINPAATEVCDTEDNDCDGDIDDADASLDTSTATTWYADSDTDGYGDLAAVTVACEQPTGTVTDATDCDDTDGAVNPTATEVCDTVDNDCDGDIDDADASLDTSTATTWFADTDTDTYGDASSTTLACDQPSGFVSDSTDCDDTDGAIQPGATEVCDTIDNDCDGDIDDADASLDTSTATTWFADTDTDTYGDASNTDLACSQPSGFVADSTDCDDTDSAINPAATEVCDTEDNDCDGDIDDADTSLDVSTATTWYADSDTDTYGDPTNTDLACSQPSGFVSDDADCDDTDATVNPGATEIEGDGVDNDCDASTPDVTGGGTYDTSAATLNIRGVSGFEGFGNQIVTGDFNGDGDPDVVSGSGSIGTAYTFFGPLSASTTVASADATITGLSSGTVSYLTMVADDFDNDGVDDLWAAAPFATNGAAYLIYGPFSGSSSVPTAADATVTGVASSDYLGRRMAVDVDVTGDGLLDMIVAAPNHDTGGGNAGAVYVFSGPQSGSIGAASADGMIQGTSVFQGVGWDVGSGDFNGDGVGDVLVSSEYEGAYYGATWAFFGPVTGTTTVSASDVKLTGPGSGNYFGWDVLGLGDINGDGYDEIGVGAPFANVSTSTSGGLYVFDGSASMTGTIAASSADAIVSGNSAADYLGLDVVSMGDLDSDGSDDLMVAAPYDRASGYNAGSAYLFLGPLSGSVATSDAFVEINGTIGSGYFGSAMSPAGGDLDGDGKEDFWVSAPGASVTTSTQGVLYLFGSGSL